MPTNFSFTATTDLHGVKACGQSIGAHIAAKLESFGSDERTLTDELCDMLCIWLKSHPRASPAIQIKLQKSTPNEESQNGADLRLVIQSPEGIKDCLFQAKVLDPQTGKLRCATATGFAKLEDQLSKARATCGDLAFLLVYVPSQHLDGSLYRYGTYEQHFCRKSKHGLPSALGATVIPASSLLTTGGTWKNPTDPVPHVNGKFVGGIAFWQVFLELLVCRRGTWDRQRSELLLSKDDRTLNFLQLVVRAKSEIPWGQLRGSSSELLGPEN
ncbi:hypothetical protein [Pseudoxanthomonas sp. X-1]|uniref:hypothetical protein n=1 Tax=Pseudoxanthomonas sp. X-1 TaxID=2571115 RepID=UPI00110AC083|nr:hypothetical protein [Pseudoxanthomonas sp. X-1]TMN16199.1 hypothetical protein FF950_19030 [Pseudoxanthomonas sp. X-1]UAY74704.1 hypothetical protein LAJ50_20150 [Pseudoxanthomonas sp. X-1]